MRLGRVKIENFVFIFPLRSAFTIFDQRTKINSLPVFAGLSTRMDVEQLKRVYSASKERSITGRIVPPERVFSLCQAFGAQTECVGTSVLGRPICSVKFGRGPRRILFWTQMHGNEPTATGAVFDLLNFLKACPEASERYVERLHEDFTLLFVPMLNPDGAVLFRRSNALGVDLNRDALALAAPESRILRRVLQDFRPEYCFNLHDQRNIYNVSGTPRTATLSFLAPSEDLQRTVTPGRKASMALIAAMNRCVQQIIPGCVGRYSDEFYPTAVGDTCQKAGYRTVLIESGTYPGDPERQVARFGNFAAILSALEYLSHPGDLTRGWEDYETIPRNDTKMMDVILRGVRTSLGDCSARVDIGVMFEEKPSADGQSLVKKAVIEAIGDLRYYYGICEIDAKEEPVTGLGTCPQVGDALPWDTLAGK